MLQPRRRWTTVATVAVIVSLFADCIMSGKENVIGAFDTEFSNEF